MPASRLLAAPVALLALASPRPCFAADGQAERPMADTVRTIEITAERFRFVPSHIEVVQGEIVRFRIRSIDVRHGLSIPDMGVSAVVGAGEEAVVEFLAGTPGDHPFECSVFCGTGHGQMVGTLTVLATAGVQLAAQTPTGTGVDAAEVDSVEPDFSLVSLPTTLGLPRNRFGFRLVHRFSRPLDGGPGYGNLLEDLFGFDSQAQIGLELRYGLVPRLQIGVHRNNTRNIQLFGRYQVLRPTDDIGFGLDAIVSIDGRDNFREEHSPAFGAVLSQRLGGLAAVYVEPMWIENVDNGAILHPQATPFEKSDDDAFVLGIGTRIRVRPTVSVVAEFLPRLYGFDQGEEYAGFAIEKQAGGHVFQLNVSNSIGTTPLQLTQGGSKSWFIGFNITRRFF